MRVLLIAPQPFYEERGTPIAVKLLAETLCQFGHEVDLLVYHAGANVAIPGLRIIRASRPPGVNHVPIGVSWQKLLCDVALVARMISLLARNRYDVIHAVEEAIFPAALLNAFSSRKLVYDMDSSLSEQVVHKWPLLKPLEWCLMQVERLAVKRSTAVLAVCEDLAVKVRPWLGERRVVVLPDVPLSGEALGDDVDSLRDVARGAVIGLYVGNLERYQGIDLLLEGVAKLPADTDICVIVIGGDAASIARYKRRAQELGVSARVVFLGARPVAHLNEYLVQADVLLSPRIAGQNTPMKLYSYMQAGKAILATDIRSHTQVLDPESAKLIAPEPAAFAAGLDRLVRDPDLRKRLGESARSLAEREYSLPAFRRRLESAYALVAGAD